MSIVIARKIPDKSRKWLLETNAIYKAVANNTDPHMKGLLTIWDNYIERLDVKEYECSWCMQRILNNYLNLQAALLILEKEKNLLEL